MTRWGLMWPASQVEGEREPPMSRNDSLGVDVAGVAGGGGERAPESPQQVGICGVQSLAPRRRSPSCRAVEAEPSRALLDGFVGLRARLALNEALSWALEPRLYSVNAMRHVDLHVMCSNFILSICTVFQPQSENDNTQPQETVLWEL